MGLYKYLSQELRRTCEADWRATGFRKLSLAWQSDALIHYKGLVAKLGKSHAQPHYIRKEQV